MFQFPKMLKVFRDQALQDAFERDGFVVVPFYNKNEVAELTDLYQRLHPRDEKGFFPSTFSSDKDYRAKADEDIRRIGERSIDHFLQDIKVICGSFIVKSPGPESAMCVHQDMTLVDESKYTGINIWVPLVDLNDTNGALQVLRGSHRFFPTYRGSTIPGIYDESSEEIKPLLETLYLKAGEAVFFDQSIIHYSDANISDKIRIVTNTYFTHKDATFRIAYWDKDNMGDKVELFDEDETFMTDFEQFGHNIHDKPKIGKSLGLVDYDFPKITLDLLEQKFDVIIPRKTTKSSAEWGSSKRIFKDDSMQALFEKQGFLVVPFINDDEVKYLNELFDQLHPDLPKDGGFVSGSYSPDLAYKKKASDEIVKVFDRHYKRLFVNYKPFGAAFLFKMPTQHSELSIHQDWTIVDEEQYVALNCWVPLNDIDEVNGALNVLPGSQYSELLKTIRCPTMGFFFSGNDDIAINASVPMYVKAGEAVILNQSVVHYSPPNRSNKVRKAITAGVKSAGQPMTFHYKDPEKNDGQLEVFEMPEDFLISFDNFYTDIMQRPKMGESKGFREYSLPSLNREELLQLINKMREKAGYSPVEEYKVPEPKKNLLRRIAAVFQ